MSILLGRNPGDSRPRQGITAQPVSPDGPPGLPASLLERRPDVLEAEALLVAANARIGEAKALFFPRISLTGLLGFESNELNDWFTHNAHTWTIAANSTQPIFTGGRLYFNYKAVKARREQAVERLSERDPAGAARSGRCTGQPQVCVQEREQREKQVEALTHASKLASLRYQGGRSGYLEVLDAEREQFNAELQLAQARLAEQIGVVQLYRALGGGWQQEMPEVLQASE